MGYRANSGIQWLSTGGKSSTSIVRSTGRQHGSLPSLSPQDHEQTQRNVHHSDIARREHTSRLVGSPCIVFRVWPPRSQNIVSFQTQCPPSWGHGRWPHRYRAQLDGPYPDVPYYRALTTKKNESKWVKFWAARYHIINGVLYKRSYKLSYL